MSALASTLLPAREELEDVLEQLLGAGTTISERTPNEYASWHPSEIVACRTGEGELRRVLCKYGPTGAGTSHGHRGGVDYEGEVYRHVLAARRLGTPRLWGVHHDPEQGVSCLVIEYIEHALPLRAHAELMDAAAMWIGRFHAAFERRLSAPPLGFLIRYERDYFSGWPTRADEFARALGKRPPRWWSQLLERFDECSQILLDAPFAVIHGECYPENLLCSQERIRPVDWQSAAIGPGEVDLAALIEGWSDESAQGCVERYCAARWPGGAPAGFPRVLDAARVYLALRWLGDKPAMTAREWNPQHLGHLGRAARRLGLIG
jgi:hypothetical protein